MKRPRERFATATLLARGITPCLRCSKSISLGVNAEPSGGNVHSCDRAKSKAASLQNDPYYF